MNEKFCQKILILKSLFKIRPDDGCLAQNLPSLTRKLASMLIYWWTGGEDSTGARLVDRRRGFYWCKVSGQEAQILLVQG
jgi:hypothetical protein